MQVRHIPTPADSHQCDGTVKRSNGTPRSYFNRLRECYSLSTVADLCYEAAYVNNNNQGSKISSAFAFLYNLSPLLSGETQLRTTPPPSLREHTAQVVRRRIYVMLRSSKRYPEIAGVGDNLYIWRDKLGCVGP